MVFAGTLARLFFLLTLLEVQVIIFMWLLGQAIASLLKCPVLAWEGPELWCPLCLQPGGAQWHGLKPAERGPQLGGV